MMKYFNQFWASGRQQSPKGANSEGRLGAAQWGPQLHLGAQQDQPQVLPLPPHANPFKVVAQILVIISAVFRWKVKYKNK